MVSYPHFLKYEAEKLVKKIAQPFDRGRGDMLSLK